MKNTPSFRADCRLAALCAAWLVLVAGGSAYLMDYGGALGPQRTAPESWPSESLIPHENGTAHALMFIHPRCPCTLASLRQLERALTHGQGRVKVHIVAFEAAGQGEKWTRTPLVAKAGALADAQVILDRDGREAERFGAMTSGHVLLYNTKGRLAFSGGITPGRGHEGACAGLEALVTRLRNESTGAWRVGVFGCAIFDSAATCEKGGGPCQCTK